MLLMLQLLCHHGEALLIHCWCCSSWNHGRLGLDPWHYGMWGHPTLLLLLDAVLLDQLRVLLLLLPDLNMETLLFTSATNWMCKQHKPSNSPL